MSHILLDTHVWAWSLAGSDKLPAGAIAAIGAAETVSVSAISFYEIGQKVRLGKWPQMQPYLYELLDIAEQQGVTLLPVSPIICTAAAEFPWDHRDPFDRIIAASAIVGRLELVSADSAFDAFEGNDFWLGRVW